MSQKNEIILIGGGGHCKSCIDVLEHENKYIIKGIIDIQENVGKDVLGYPIIGTDDDLAKISKEFDHFLITIGHIKSSELRSKLFDKIRNFGKSLPTIISPNSFVSKHADIGEGTIIMHNAQVNAGSTIGLNCIINSKSLIEHDAVLKNNCHVSTGAIVNGNCMIGSGTFLGSSSTLNHGIKIAENCVIGSGSIVINDIDRVGSTWVGNPARIKKVN